jgi:hypothetical protein
VLRVFHNPDKGWIFNDGLIFMTSFYVGIFAIEYLLMGFRTAYRANHIYSLRESDGILTTNNKPNGFECY